MTSTYFKKIISGLLILSLVAGMFAVPRKAEAVITVQEIGASLYQQIASTISAGTTAASSYSIAFKEFVLDTLATTLAKMLIRQITADVVNWINSGFEGSPAFLTNPGAFFIDVADQVTGEFLNKYGGPLTELCSPFSIDVRLALAFRYHPKIQKKYACTLGTIIANSQNAVENATLNGQRVSSFMNGDFSQGGWPAFVSLTTEPQNNVYGAYLTAESDISIQVANRQISKKEELSQGRGFLSWRNSSCKREVEQHNNQIKQNYEDLENATGEDYISTQERIGGDDSQLTPRSVNDCPIETPGSLIAGGLENSANGPLRELELVDSINQIVNALAAQLITQILQGGLKAISGSGPSDSTNYLNQIQYEAANFQGADMQTMRNNFLESVEKYIRDTLEYKQSWDKSLNLMLSVKAAYDTARACYVSKINMSGVPDRIAELDRKIAEKVTPRASTYLDLAQEADQDYNYLVRLRDQARAATTINDLRAPIAAFTQLLQNQNLVDATDLVNARREYDELVPQAEEMKQDALRENQQCLVLGSGFPILYRSYNQ